jgi:hypothetical protein
VTDTYTDTYTADYGGGAPPPGTLTLVNSTSGSWTLPVGPQTLPFTNTQGNLLVAFVFWESSSAPAMVPDILPAATICDSVGNWWRLVADTGGNSSSIRTAIWVCDNALSIPATGWFSVAVPGYVLELACCVAEFSGIPAGYEPVIDFSVPFASNSSTEISLSAIISQADYCFLAGVSFSQTLTPPGSPWLPITSSRSVIMYASYADSPFVSGNIAIAAADACAGAVIGISQASYPPANGNVNFPVVRLEVAFGATPGDPTQAILDNEWTDITERAIAAGEAVDISVTRGRQYELATPESGEITASLNNLDGAFDPAWPGSPYYSNSLNANMSFQLGIAPWQPSNAAVSLTETYNFASGVNAVASQSMQVTPAGGTGPMIAGDLVPINSNNVYSASAWLLCPSGWEAGGSVSINWYAAGGAYIETATGVSIALPASANTWTQVTITAVVPPSDAVFAQMVVELAGSPTSTTVYYVAEAAIVTGSNIVKTGLVRLQTPVRISAYWQGRRYPVGYGYVERWPQSWPQLPQWGFSPMIATDVVGVVNSVNLPSAVRGEILADQPYLCFPFDEQYQTTSNTINGVSATASDASGLIATNVSRVNQQTANYISGDQIIETGQTMSFEGDSGTGMGVTGYTDLVVTGFRGSGAVYGPDSSLPVIGQSAGLTADFWVTVPSVANNSGSVSVIPFIQLYGKPYVNSISPANLAPGWIASAGIYLTESGTAIGTAVSFIQCSKQTTISVGSVFPYDSLCHVLLSIPPSSTEMISYLNGTYSTVVPSSLAGPVTALTFGQADYSYGSAWSHWNYAFAYGSVYPYALSTSRITSHYNAGANGFAGDSITERFGRYLAWSQLNVNPAGPGGISGPPDAFQLSSAYSTSGSSLASALNTDTQSAGATWYGNASGNLVILPRGAVYRQPATIVFGDDAAVILNANPDFQQNGIGWVTVNGEFSVTNSPPAGSPYVTAAFFSPTAANNALLEETGAVTVAAGDDYVINGWFWTDSESVSTGLYWVNDAGVIISSTTFTTVVQFETWSYVSAAATAPADATAAYPFAGLPSDDGILYAEHVIVVNANTEVPYDRSLQLDYDNTYLQNVTQATLTQGANTLISPTEKDVTSIGTYLTRGPQSFTVNGASAQDAYDVAYWYLSKYKQPQLRIAQVTVDVANDPLIFEQVLQTDIATVGILNRRPIGGPPYSLPVICQHVEISIGPGLWKVAYQLSPYTQEDQVLVSDTTGQNVLGSSTLAW